MPLPASSQFVVPKDGPTYIEQVRSRCHDLIQCGIWAGLQKQSLNQWWSNFKSDTEQYFAACLLDSVIYRSKEQTIALIHHLVQRALPDLGRATGGIEDWGERLRPNLLDAKIRFVPVIPHGSAQAKSAYIILRHLEKKLGVPSVLFAKAEEIGSLVSSGIEAVVFIDDLLGTGIQFVKEFATPYSLATFGTQARLIYAPLVAHEEGIKYVRSQVPNVFLTSAETLGKSHAIFGNHGRTFNDGINSPDAAWAFYPEILSSRGIALNGSAKRGFGELELAFFFEHAAPDNCLPIFWWNNCADWKPLVCR